jgi:predicted transposase YbfD/YdcC
METKKNVCQYCDSEFNTKAHLERHQTTVKYCLKLQEKTVLNDNERRYVCSDGCGKSITSKQNYIKHVESCKVLCQKKCKDYEISLKEKDDLINNLRAKVEILEKDRDLVHEIAKQPKQQQTNNTQNNKYVILSPFSMTQNEINNIVNEKFTKEHFLNGQQGVARFANANILKDMKGNLTYMCVDPSRNIFNYKDKEGKIEKDVKATKLTDSISPAVIKKSEIIYKEIIPQDDLFRATEYAKTLLDIKRLRHDNVKFVNELSRLTHNTSSLVNKDDDDDDVVIDFSTDEIEYVIEDYTDDEKESIEVVNKLCQKQLEDLAKVNSYIGHSNPNLYKYYRRKYIEKYGDELIL